MDFDKAAKTLITAVGGELSDKNLEGVISVMETIVEITNQNWETWLAIETTDVLALDGVTCPCGQDILVTRERKCVYTDLV